MSAPVLAPGATIGILGGGQLGRMLCLAAARLGLRCHVFSDASGPAFDVAAQTTVAPFDDAAALRAFGRSVDVATIEFENVPAAALARVAEVARVYPPLRAVQVSQDRLAEKEFVAELGIAVAPFCRIDSASDIEAGLAATGLPALLKTRHLGYDGKGQVLIGRTDAACEAWQGVGQVPSLLEGFVDFTMEVSVLVVRSPRGEMVFYDPSQNRHENGILAETRVPAPLAPATREAACDIARRIAQGLDYVGVLAVEMFLCGRPHERQSLLVNEIAPRVHNSGHWTIDACLVSQFENHIRAIAGWPLGSTARHSDAVMTNLIGDDVARWHELAAVPDLAVHIYGKREARPGRKMGHVTRLLPRSD